MLSQNPKQIRRRAKRQCEAKKRGPRPPQVAHTPDEVYSKLSAFADRFKCGDCGWGADGPMLKDELWLSIARKEEVLCISCTEQRLGRKLMPSDLKRCLMNGAALYFLERYYD